MRNSTLRVAVAVDLPESQCERISELEPRCVVAYQHDLYRPMRWSADWGGDPNRRRDAAQQRAFDSLLGGADALFGIPDDNPSTLARVIASNPDLRWIHTTAAGGGGQTKAADLPAEVLQRITFTTSAGVHAEPLAEFAMFGLLAGAKELPRLAELQAKKVWASRFVMRHVTDMTVLVLGLGGIGTEVARQASALGATVWGTSRSGTPVPGVDRLIPTDDLAEAMPHVDAIIVTLPGTDRTHGLVGADLLSQIRPGTIVVNVGRGTVIDEVALLAALNDGRVGFAALDVFAVEPLPQDSPLWTHPRVLVSPHTAALNDAEPARIVDLFADNARRLLDSVPLRNVVDTVEFY